MKNTIQFPLRSGKPFYNKVLVAILRSKPALPKALAAGGNAA